MGSASRSRARNRLSALAISKIKEPCALHDGGGLYLQVTRSGVGQIRKSWVLRVRLLSGRIREMGLGSLHDVGLAEARLAADDARKLAREGHDPIEVRRQRVLDAQQADRPVPTFRQCVESYVAANKGSWRNEKYQRQWTAPLERYAYPTFGSLPVSEINVSHVTAVLDPIWSEKTETAGRVRQRVEAILDWATVRGHRAGENPARWKGHLSKALPAPGKIAKVRHHPAISYKDAAHFMSLLRTRDGSGAKAFEFTILTAARTSETLGARWGEIDLDKAVWAVPGNRIKSGRPHRVPLSTQALCLLTTLEAGAPTELIFPGRGEDVRLSGMVFLMTLRRMGRPDLTAHGFRSTFRDWAAECTDYPNEVAEAALAHIVGDRTEAAYRRGDLFEKRRKMMQDWADFLDRVNNVVALPTQETADLDDIAC